MSEYSFVEKPFLDQLDALDWTVIDQGPGVPTDPTKSLRASFREVTLRDVFNQAVRAINTTPDGRTWLTDKQLDDLHDELFSHSGRSLVENNEAVLKLLFRSQVDANELTGEQYPNVKLIDFEHPERNQFHAINQFRIDTPRATKGFIIPDIVLFVNGLPLVVIECKDANDFTANPMYEAFQQLMCYSDQREETKQSGLREGEPRLFFTNQLLIRTSGEQADIGTITSTDEEFFFPRRDIYPEKYRTFTPPLGKVRPQETLIQGVLPKETLLDKGNILFSKIGSALGKGVVYDGSRGVCNSNAAVAKIDIDSRVAGRHFVNYFLNHDIAKVQLRNMIVSLLPRINLGDLSSLLIPTPAIEEQQNIEPRFLSADMAIQSEKAALVHLSEVKTGLMQDLLTGKVRVNVDEAEEVIP